jgi:glycosyltransferase involved in cell wall biosynthesis
MACGCPVVAWNDNAGPNETVVNGITGILAKPYDLDEMAKSIEYIIKSGLKQKNKAKIINSVRRFSEKDAGIRMLLLVRGISRKL